MQNTAVLGAAQDDGTSVSDRQRTAKLADGARQFEAMMLQEMLKPLKFGDAPGSGDGDEEGGANGTLQSYGTEALAKSIASQGGFGIARKIIQQVTAEDVVKRGSRGETKVE
jgi:Rod binding domain-containing protein